MTPAQMVVGSITRPQRVAQALIAMDPPLALRWQAFGLCAILSTLLTSVTIALAGPGALIGDGALGGPLATTGIEMAINLLAVVLVTGVGQLAGGQGRFADALLLVTWLQVLLLLWQVPQCVALLVAPVLFLPLVSVGIVLMFWLLTQFITALHGFRSPLRVFLLMIGLFFLIGAAVAPFLRPMGAVGG